jgi:hypothetical protein
MSVATPAEVRTRRDDGVGVPTASLTPERLAKRDVHIEVIAEAAPFSPAGDWTGDAKGEYPRMVVIGHAARADNATAAERLKRFRDLTAGQIEAGARFELDWQQAALEPRVTANLNSNGGGRGIIDLGQNVLDARGRLYLARMALNDCGLETVRVVDAVVLEGLAATDIMAGCRKAEALTRVRAHLSLGLEGLARHYARPWAQKMAQAARQATNAAGAQLYALQRGDFGEDDA